MGTSVLRTDRDRTIEFHWDQSSKKLTVNHTQDAQPVVDRVRAIRTSGDYNRKAAFQLFASLPNSTVYELKTKGIDIFRMKHDPSMRKAFLRAMHFDYPLLKATTHTHLA